MARVIHSEQAMFVIVSQQAQAGHAGAQFELGTCYLHAKGVTADAQQALFWFLKAAHQNHGAAQRMAGNVYARELEDYEQAVRWYRQSARCGNAKSKFNLGLMYQIGYGVEKDYAQAFQWNISAAQQGYAAAQFNLGLLYGEGKGTAQDAASSFEWFMRAAEQNHATAQYNVGAACEQGRGTGRNMTQAIRWYRRAAHNGDYSAQLALANALLETRDVPGDGKDSQAYVWMAVASHAQTLPPAMSGAFNAIARSIAENDVRELNELVGELVGAIRPYRSSNPPIYGAASRLFTVSH